MWLEFGDNAQLLHLQPLLLAQHLLGAAWKQLAHLGLARRMGSRVDVVLDAMGRGGPEVWLVDVGVTSQQRLVLLGDVVRLRLVLGVADLRPRLETRAVLADSGQPKQFLPCWRQL